MGKFCPPTTHVQDPLPSSLCTGPFYLIHCTLHCSSSGLSNSHWMPNASFCLCMFLGICLVVHSHDVIWWPLSSYVFTPTLLTEGWSARDYPSSTKKKPPPTTHVQRASFGDLSLRSNCSTRTMCLLHVMPSYPSNRHCRNLLASPPTRSLLGSALPLRSLISFCQAGSVVYAATTCLAQRPTQLSRMGEVEFWLKVCRELPHRKGVSNSWVGWMSLLHVRFFTSSNWTRAQMLFSFIYLFIFHLFIYLFMCLFTYFFPIYLSIYLCVYLFIYLSIFFNLFIYVFIYLFIYLCINFFLSFFLSLFIYLFIYVLIYLFISLFVYLFIYLFMCLFIYLFISLFFIYLSIYIFLYLFFFFIYLFFLCFLSFFLSFFVFSLFLSFYLSSFFLCLFLLCLFVCLFVWFYPDEVLSGFRQ